MMRGLLLLSLCLLPVSACATFRSGTAPNAALDAIVELRAEIAAVHKEFTARDVTVGGGTDSIALWLAIISLFLLPVTALAGALVYQHILRPRRIVKENGNHAGGCK